MNAEEEEILAGYIQVSNTLSEFDRAFRMQDKQRCKEILAKLHCFTEDLDEAGWSKKIEDDGGEPL